MNDAQQFYDDLADDYQFIFADWQNTVSRQANIISAFLLSQGIDNTKTILDCTCGIGTQAIALATKGYQVHGTDLSAKSIARAREYAQQFDTSHPITFDVADLLQAPDNPQIYDVVLAFDNPIAHFQTDDDLATAFTTMAAHLKEGGLLTTSLRDYAALSQERPRQSHISVTDREGVRRIIFQVWDWSEDGTSYDSEMFMLTNTDDEWQTKTVKSKFHAWRRAEVCCILDEVGLSDIQWHIPETTGFYQPIVTARK